MDRIDAGIGFFISNTQYGFRQGKSTAQAIYLARRILDLSEREGSNLSMILLDWEKAFDKIDHSRLLEALERLGVPSNMLSLIKTIYREPKFRVKSGEFKSDYKTQSSGIRQGCPLSPYLFVLVMTVLMKDVKSRLNTKRQNEPINGIKFSEILYADDTLLFGPHTQNINKLLKEIQIESNYYNLNLNLGKCINLTLNQQQTSVKFASNEFVPRHKKATYLGTLLTDTNDNHAELNNRIADTTATANKLKIFWQKAKTDVKWKLQVYDAIVKSKLLYGLECIQLTQVEQNRLDAYQMKGIRRILSIPPTFVDRTWTNKMVMERATEEAGKPIKTFSESWRSQKFKLLGHLLRAEVTDPLHQVTFEGESKFPRLAVRRRVGRPRENWLLTTMKEAYKLFVPSEFSELDIWNEHELNWLVTFARNGEDIFRTNNKHNLTKCFSNPNIVLDRSV